MCVCVTVLFQKKISRQPNCAVGYRFCFFFRSSIIHSQTELSYLRIGLQRTRHKLVVLYLHFVYYSGHYGANKVTKNIEFASGSNALDQVHCFLCVFFFILSFKMLNVTVSAHSGNLTLWCKSKTYKTVKNCDKGHFIVKQDRTVFIIHFISYFICQEGSNATICSTE